MQGLQLILRLFGEHIGLAVLLAAGVIAAYWAAYGFLSVSSRLFVGYPVAAAVALTRRYLRTPNVRRGLATGSLDYGREIDMLASRLDSKSGIWQRRLERLRSQRQLLAMLLFRQDALNLETRILEAQALRLLETDRTVLESLSVSQELNERGVLNISANPLLRDLISPTEELGILLVAWKRGGGLAEIAKYHLTHNLKGLTDPAKVAKIVQNWPEASKAEAEKFLASINQ